MLPHHTATFFSRISAAAIVSGLVGLYCTEVHAAAIPVTTGLTGQFESDAVFSDAAGTTPASVGDPIALVRNQASPGTNDATQATAGNRPTLVAVDSNGDGQANERAIHFDGASGFLSSALNVSPSGTSTGLTFFIVASGTNYQSIIRFQDVDSSYVVYPYRSNNNGLILSNDGGVGSHVDDGFVNNAWNVGTARWASGTINGAQTFLNGALVAQRDSSATALPSNSLTIGRYNPGANEYTAADVEAILIYNRALTDAERGQVESYLTAKYIVPEPSVIGLIGFGAIAAFRRRRI